MKIYMKHSMRRIFFLFYCLTVGFGAISAFAQKDLLLYSTDFTDWGQTHEISSDMKKVYAIGTTTEVSSSYDFSASLAGDGFKLSGKPAVTPTATIAGQKGYMYFVNGSAEDYPYLKFKPLEFVCGAVVELEMAITGTTSARTLTLDGATFVSLDAKPSDAVLASQLVGSTPVAVLGTQMSGNSITIKNATNVASQTFKVSFYFPATFTGLKTIQTSQVEDACKLQYVAITSMKVYTAVCSGVPYVASTNYSKYPAAGHSLIGTMGGAAYSGTTSNAKINVKLWNSLNNVDLTIEGSDAARFSFTNSTPSSLNLAIPNAQALAEKTVDIYFSPSIKAGVSSAQLKITAPGVSTPYYVSLTGVTASSATPQIIADTATVPFWTYTAAPVSNTINVSGLNLTGDLTFSVTGANASQFSLSSTIIKKADASTGSSLSITYTGANDPASQEAILVITSPTAPTVSIPLKGYTYDLKPKIYDLNFVISPSGTGYVTTSPQGSKFMDGTKVTATVKTENGYYVQSWSDIGPSAKISRTIQVGDMNKGTVIITLSNACLSCECQPGGCPPVSTSFILNDIPSSSITDTEFNNVSWPAVAGAVGGYIVKVYNMDGTVKSSIPVSAGTTSTSITGLTKATSYKVSVETVGLSPSEKNSGIKGPYRTTGTTFVCGQ